MRVHAVVVNPEAVRGDGEHTFGVYHRYYHEFGLLWAYRDVEEGLGLIDCLLMDAYLREKGKEKRSGMLSDAGDGTEMLIKDVEKIEENCHV